jgi:hypothetical protein
MLDIFLVESIPDALKTVKYYLSDGRYTFTVFGSLAEAAESPQVPSLVIILADKDAGKFNKNMDVLKHHTVFSKVPRIIIQSQSVPYLTEHPELLDDQPSFQMPVDKLLFLSVVARCLKRSPRRVFRILVTVQPEGSNIRYSGLSVDFSETGMAFESTADITVRKMVKVNFVNPKTRRRFDLSASIARKAATQPGGSVFYGIKFLEMTEQDMKDILQFISGGG